MVANVTSLTGNGLKDWLIQRVTAVYFAVYAVFLVIYLMAHPHLAYGQWLRLFHCVGFQIATVLALITFVLHAWIGIWTVTTDYIKHTALRVSLQMLVILVLLVQVIWGFMIVFKA